MSRYEFVWLIDPNLPSEKIEQEKKDLQEMFKDSLIDVDDIGILELEYPIKKRERAYFLSLCLNLDSKDIKWLEEKIALDSNLLRFFFYRMKDNEKFLKFKEVNKQLELTSEEKEKMAKEWAFQDMDTHNKRKK